MKFSEFLNEKKNEDGYFDSRSDLIDAISETKFEKLFKAIDSVYDDVDEDASDDDFVDAVRNALSGIGARDIADTVETIKDFSYLEKYIGDGQNINSTADQLHYDQHSKDMAKAIIEFLV